MRNFKRIAAAALSATMLLSTMSLTAFADRMSVADATAAVGVDLAATDLIGAKLAVDTATVAPGGTFTLTLTLDGVGNTASKVLNVGSLLTEIKYDVTKFDLVCETKEDDVFTDEGRKSVPFGIYAAYAPVNTKDSLVAIGDTSPFKIIPTSDFAVFKVTAKADAVKDGEQYEFVASYVAATTPDGYPSINKTPNKVIVTIGAGGGAPSQTPSEAPSQTPSEAPSQAPSEAPSQAPSQAPSEAPTQAPTQAPTTAPSKVTVDDVVAKFETLLTKVPANKIVAALEGALSTEELDEIAEFAEMLNQLSEAAKTEFVGKAMNNESIKTALGDSDINKVVSGAQTAASLHDTITIKEPSIKVKKDFTLELERKFTEYEGKAVITFSKSGTTLATRTYTFDKGESKKSETISALEDIAKGDEITIDVVYSVIIDSQEKQSATNSITVIATKTSGSSATTPVAGGSGGSGSTSATAAPDASEKPEASSTPSTSDNTPTATGSKFADVAAQAPWAAAEIDKLAEAGIVNGISATEFAPMANVTREQFVKMIVGALGLELMDTPVSFNDVEAGQYYVPYVATAVQAGIVNGMSDEWFGIGQNITREDMATIIYRALKLNGTSVPAFTDAADISGYAQPAVAELANLGVITGYEDGSFQPKANATRAEAAVVLCRVIGIIGE